MAEVTAIYKKDNPLDKSNYRPISLLSHISKIFEKLLFNQINEYMQPHFSALLTGFRKNHNTQHSLIKMLEKWKYLLDKDYHIGAVYMDLSKAFDVLNHNLLLAKLDAYGFNRDATSLIQDYLSNRLQRVKISDKFSSWQTILTGVPQGSILGPLFFNIFLNDIFYVQRKGELCNYADDNTLYVYGKDLHQIKTDLLDDFDNLNSWFYENYMVLNPKKCQFMCLGKNKDGQSLFYKNNIHLETTASKELLGVIIDNNLNFNDHINNICKKAGRKLNALSRLSHLMKKDQKILIYNSFITGQFNYCPLTWMFCSRKANNKINKLHERSLRLCNNNYTSTYNDLLNEFNIHTIHTRNLHKLMLEIYKIFEWMVSSNYEWYVYTKRKRV